MATKERAKIACQPPQGRITNANPHLIGPGATQVQLNMECRFAGQWDVRKGMRPVTFANAAASLGAGVDVIAIGRFKHPTGEFVIYETSTGVVRAGRTAS